MTLTTAPRGTFDLMPQQALVWQWMESKIRDVLLSYGYGEIRTPIFEHTELFQRGIGETTDIVEKEMYTLTDKGGRSLTLRPEGTASVVRAYIQHKLYGQAPVTKLFYIGPMFRQERPQAGRFRQFHQFGVEMIGEESPVADAEVIILAHDLYCQLGLTALEIHLNTVGCPECRQEYKAASLPPWRRWLNALLHLPGPPGTESLTGLDLKVRLPRTDRPGAVDPHYLLPTAVTILTRLQPSLSRSVSNINCLPSWFGD